MQTRNTAGLACCAVSAKNPDFLREQVIGSDPEKAVWIRCGNAERTSQKTYKLCSFAQLKQIFAGGLPTQQREPAEPFFAPDRAMRYTILSKEVSFV